MANVRLTGQKTLPRMGSRIDGLRLALSILAFGGLTYGISAIDQLIPQPNLLSSKSSDLERPSDPEATPATAATPIAPLTPSPGQIVRADGSGQCTVTGGRAGSAEVSLRTPENGLFRRHTESDDPATFKFSGVNEGNYLVDAGDRVPFAIRCEAAIGANSPQEAWAELSSELRVAAMVRDARNTASGARGVVGPAVSRTGDLDGLLVA